jgi:hypothetical protein
MFPSYPLVSDASLSSPHCSSLVSCWKPGASTAKGMKSPVPCSSRPAFSAADQLHPPLALLLSMDAVLESSLSGRNWRRRRGGFREASAASTSSRRKSGPGGGDSWAAQLLLPGQDRHRVRGGGRSRVVPPLYQLERHGVFAWCLRASAREPLGYGSAVYRLVSTSTSDTKSR